MDSNFRDAVEVCSKDCFGVHANPNQFNARKTIFDIRQDEIQKRMSGLSKGEKDSVMKNMIFTELRKHTIIDTSTRVSLEFIESFGKETMTLCEDCFCMLYKRRSKRTYESWKNSLKKSMVHDNAAAEVQCRLQTLISRKHKNCEKTRYKNIYEARAQLQDFNLTEEQLHLAVIPSTPKARQAYHWMSEFFAMTGDVAPNRDNKVQLPGFYTKSDIYDVFKRFVTLVYCADEHEVASKTLFKNIWKTVFPRVTITRFCQVTGKCDPCYWIFERQEQLHSAKDIQELRQFSVVHKVMIEQERAAYMNKRQMAQLHPTLYMSLIIDAMSQDHCVLPWYGNKVQSSFPLKQKIIGVKQHGKSKTFYRAFPHVKGGANITCEILLREIENRMMKCKASGETFPQILFLQVDGGPDNNSKTFYGFCEQLVRDGVFHRIELCRLPVGHTHEDIDALFGTLWKKAQKQIIMSPREWKQMCLAAFSLQFDIEDEDIDKLDKIYNDE